MDRFEREALDRHITGNYGEDQFDGVDKFTRGHLRSFVEQVLFDDEAEAFEAWALDALADDPGLADTGWPTLVRVWRAELRRGGSL
jgi:hypothetical protein